METKKKRYSAEFKQEVINYAMASDQKVTEICRHFDLSKNRFYQWKKDLLGNNESNNPASSSQSNESKADLMDEIRSLRVQLSRRDRDIEILKKATLIFGNNPH